MNRVDYILKAFSANQIRFLSQLVKTRKNIIELTEDEEYAGELLDKAEKLVNHRAKV